MSNYLALRSSATPSFTVSTLTGSTITAKVISLQSTTVSIGQSTNQAYTNFTSGSFSSTLMTSTLTSYNSLSTVTKVSMNQDGRFQYALQSVPSTANYYQLSRSSDTGLTWNTLNTSTMGLPQGSLAYQSTVSGFPTYSNISQSATGQYALAAASGGQLYVSNNASSATPVYTPANVGGAPYAYLPMDSLPITDMMGNTITTGGSPPLTTTRKVGTAAINLLQTGGGTPSQYLNIPWTGAANFTISFWFNPQNVNSTFQYVCSAYSGRVNIQINSSNQFYFVFPSGGLTNTTSIAGPTTVLNNTWYHVVAIFQTGGTCSLYVNSTFYGSVTNTSGVGINTTTQISLGSADNAPAYAFSGYIDDFRLYNFAAPNVVPPYIYLPLDGNTVDAMGNTTITPGSAPSSTAIPGYVFGAPVGSRTLSLANTAGGTATQYIRGAWAGNSAFTVSLWVNAQSFGGSNNQIIFDSYSNTFIIYITPGSNQLVLYTYNNSGIANVAATPYPITLNTWYNVSASFQNSGTGYFYVNNALIGTYTCGASLGTVSNFCLGTYAGSTPQAFNGYIDDLRIYNYAVTPSVIVPMNWSHTAVSGTGQYMMAAAANGGVFYSINYGATWSQLTASQISSLVGTGNTAKTLMGPIIQPQLTGLAAATWSVNGVTWTASASTTISTYFPYKAFDNTLTSPNSWNNTSQTYTTAGNSSGIYTTIQGIGSVQGDWLQLQSSVPLVIYSYQFSIGGGLLQFPSTFYSIGSNDGTTWYPIQKCVASSTTSAPSTANTLIPGTIIASTSGSQTFGTITLTTTTYSTTTNTYIYFRILGTSNYSSTNAYLEIGEWYANFSTPTPLLTAPATAPSTATSAVTVSPQMTNMTAPSATTSWSTPNGVTWLASATSTYTGNSPINYPGLAFNGVISGATTFSWASGTTNYVNGVAQTTNTNMSAVYSTSGTINIKGEALQLQASVPLVMNSYSYAGSAYVYAPKTYYILGSNDGTTWYNLHSASTPTNPFGTTNTIPLTTYITVNFTGTQPVISSGGSTTTTTTATQYSTNAYTYFRIIADNVYSGTIFELAEFYANFTAYTPNPVNALAITNGGQNMLVAATGTTMPNVAGLAANTWTANGVTWTASQSSAANSNTYLGYLAFNNALTAPDWACGNAIALYTSATPGVPNANTAVVSNVTGLPSGTTITGEWLEIQSSVPLIMYSYMSASGATAIYAPRTYNIIGSNDRTNWFNLHSASHSTNPTTTTFSTYTPYIFVNYSGSQTVTGQATSTVTTATTTYATNAYTYFRLVVTSIFTGNIAEIGEWFINFQAGSTYLSTNYGSTWSTVCTAPPNAPILATSGNGQYTITGSGQIANVYSNAALTAYTTPTLTGITANINCASISSSGQNMIILTQGTTNNVFYSTNFGVTFTGMTVGTLPMTSCAMSADGNEIMVSNAANVWVLNRNTQGFSITMGNQSGLTNQGQNSIAIGNLAGVLNQSANSIILNASGAVQDAYNPGFFVSPILSQTTSTQSSVALLGYGGDNQVVQTGMSVRADGTLNPFNVNSTGNVSFAGNIGIGLTNPTAPLHLYAPSSTVWPFSFNYSSGPQLVIGNAGVASIIAFDTYNTVMGTRPSLCLNPSGGYVGIGLANPLYPLHVMGAGSSASSSAINYTGSYYIQPTPSSGSAAATSSGTINGNVIGIFSYYAIVSAVSVNAVYFSSYSDVRIKKNIQPLQYSALPLIEQFRIVSYDHVDKRNKPCGAGVIGQEMEAIFPSCIEKDAKVVPNIYERGVHTLEEDIICIRLISQDDQPVFKTDADILNSKKISLRVVKQDKKEHIIDCDLLETDGAVFKVKKWDDYTADDLIFVYGTEVPDFLTVDKHMLSMIGLKGIQELAIKATSSASQIQELVGQTVQLSAENTQLKSAIAAQASAMALLEARLAALESKS